MRRIILALSGLAAALLIWAIPGAGTSSAETITTTDFAVAITCSGNPTPQLCAPLYQTTVTTSGWLAVEFIASPAHCSSIRVYIFVDGFVRTTSGFLGAGQSTGGQSYTPVFAGSHTVGVQAEGTPGGCNNGSLGSWSGTLKVTTSTLSFEEQRLANLPCCNGGAIAAIGAAAARAAAANRARAAATPLPAPVTPPSTGEGQVARSPSSLPSTGDAGPLSPSRGDDVTVALLIAGLAFLSIGGAIALRVRRV